MSERPEASELKRLQISLTKRQLQTLRGDNPFRNERNTLICELWTRGVKLPLLVKLTGLPKTTVHRIATTGVSYTKFRMKSSTAEAIDYGRLRRAFSVFYREIMKCMNIKPRGGSK